MKNKELRELAKQRMEGKMGKAFGISIIYFIIVFALSCIPVIGSLISAIIAAPLAFGWTKQLILLANGESVGLMDFFEHGFENFGKVWCSNLWITLKALIPGILLIVGSVLATTVNGILGMLVSLIAIIWLIDVVLKYVMINYTIAYNVEGLRAKELINKSAEEAKGHIWQFVCMGLYFGLQMIIAGILLAIVSGAIAGFLASINYILSFIVIILIYVFVVALSGYYTIRNIVACNELYKQSILGKGNDNVIY